MSGSREIPSPCDIEAFEGCQYILFKARRGSLASLGRIELHVSRSPTGNPEETIRSSRRQSSTRYQRDPKHHSPPNLSNDLISSSLPSPPTLINLHPKHPSHNPRMSRNPNRPASRQRQHLLIRMIPPLPPPLNPFKHSPLLKAYHILTLQLPTLDIRSQSPESQRVHSAEESDLFSCEFHNLRACVFGFLVHFDSVEGGLAPFDGGDVDVQREHAGVLEPQVSADGDAECHWKVKAEGEVAAYRVLKTDRLCVVWVAVGVERQQAVERRSRHGIFMRSETSRACRIFTVALEWPTTDSAGDCWWRWLLVKQKYMVMSLMTSQAVLSNTHAGPVERRETSLECTCVSFNDNYHYSTACPLLQVSRSILSIPNIHANAASARTRIQTRVLRPKGGQRPGRGRRSSREGAIISLVQRNLGGLVEILTCGDAAPPVYGTTDGDWPDGERVAVAKVPLVLALGRKPVVPAVPTGPTALVEAEVDWVAGTDGTELRTLEVEPGTVTKRVLVTCMVLVDRTVDSVAEPVRAPAVSPVGEEAEPLDAGAGSLAGAGTLGAAVWLVTTEATEEELGSPGAVVMVDGLTVTVSVPVICSNCQLNAPGTVCIVA